MSELVLISVFGLIGGFISGAVAQLYSWQRRKLRRSIGSKTMKLEDAMEREIDYTIPASQRTITVGEMRQVIAGFPDDFPLTILTPDGGWWFNVGGITKGDGEHSIILATRDDFDTRQW